MPEVIFNGPDGRLEGRYQGAKPATAPIALILHPHPLYGGTMNNKVVFTLYQAFAKRGGPVLAICNGFQIACEAGLLPGALIRNKTLKFHSFDQHLRVETADTFWTASYQQGDILRMPVAHAEGNYEADEATLDRIEGEGQVLFRYVDAEGRLTDEGNPNGSARSIAGIMNAGGNVMGLMPHPDRSMEAVVGSTDGRGIFEGLARYLSGAGVR